MRKISSESQRIFFALLDLWDYDWPKRPERGQKRSGPQLFLIAPVAGRSASTGVVPTV